MLANFTYRPAVPSDALTLSALATQVFFDTYATDGIDADLATEALNVYSRSIFEARLVDPELRDHRCGIR